MSKGLLIGNAYISDKGLEINLSEEGVKELKNSGVRDIQELFDALDAQKASDERLKEMYRKLGIY